MLNQLVVVPRPSQVVQHTGCGPLLGIKTYSQHIITQTSLSHLQLPQPAIHAEQRQPLNAVHLSSNSTSL